MIKPGKLIQFIQLLLSQGEKNFGDLAILKADALGAKANPEIEEHLQAVVGYYPPIDLERLLELPVNSLGYAYAHHMTGNQLQPFTVSPAMAEVAQRNVFALRYAVTHDIFHVLLGFDTSYAGEMGVLAFAVAQNYSRSQRWGMAIARWLYPLLAPGQARDIRACQQRGQALGEQAAFLLGYRFEDQWERSLEEVQRDLNLLGV